jgi:hypothetical protein
VLATFGAIYGAWNQTLDETRAVFRRADGRILLLSSRLAQLLDIFAEPVTLAKAGERLWMLDSATTHKAWDLLIGYGAIRRVAGGAPADEDKDCSNGRMLVPDAGQPVLNYFELKNPRQDP